MPLIYQHQINEDSLLGLWHITEPESFFTAAVPLGRDITHWHKRLQHLAGRYLLTALVPGFPSDLIRIADTRKPFLENEAWHFSLSHCGDYAAALVSAAQRTGVDIEGVTSKVEKVRHKFLSITEQELLSMTLSVNGGWNELELLTACWSIKEAMFKWKGTGGIDFRTHLCIETLTLSGNDGGAVCRIKKDEDRLLRVSFTRLEGSCLSWVLGG